MNRNKYNAFHPELEGLCVDLGAVRLNKHHESICGDYYTIAEENGRHVLVLSDGLGSGVKANILATLTAKMLSTMIAGNIPPEDAVRAVAKTLPVCKIRGLAYSTFTVLSMEGDRAELLQFDNPDAIMIRNGEIYDYPVHSIQVDEKTIHISNLTIREKDMLLMMSDGVTNAGIDYTTYGGWGRDDVARCCSRWYHPDMTARDMAVTIANAGYALNMEDTVDDLTILALSFCKPRVVNIMIGPPSNKADDEMYMRDFFHHEGKHVICGGTTAKIAAEYLGENIIPLPETTTADVPAMMKIPRVDLVTEGVLTLERVLELEEEIQSDPLQARGSRRGHNGVCCLEDLLFNQATHINLFFGNALNRGYVGEVMFKRSKLDTVELLIRQLRNAGKQVDIAYWAL